MQLPPAHLEESAMFSSSLFPTPWFQHFAPHSSSQDTPSPEAILFHWQREELNDTVFFILNFIHCSASFLIN